MTNILRPIIVGEAPSPSATKPGHSALFPFPESYEGARLWRMTGLSKHGYMEAFHRVNLWPVHDPDRKTSDYAWAAANLIGSRLLDGRAVVLLGELVWLAFGGVPDVEPLMWYAPCTPGFDPMCVAMVPCPKDKNPWYDDENQAGAAANFMKLLAEGDYPDLREDQG